MKHLIAFLIIVLALTSTADAQLFRRRSQGRNFQPPRPAAPATDATGAAETPAVSKPGGLSWQYGPGDDGEIKVIGSIGTKTGIARPPAYGYARGDDGIITMFDSIGTKDGKTVTATGIASPYKDPLTGKSIPSVSTVKQPAPPLVKDPVAEARMKHLRSLAIPPGTPLDAPKKAPLEAP